MYAWDFEWDREDQTDKHEHDNKVKLINPTKPNMSIARFILWFVTPVALVVTFYLTCLIHPSWLPFYHPFHLNYSHLSSSYNDWSIGQQLASMHNYLFGHRSETEGWYIKFHLPAHYANCQKDDPSGDAPNQHICEFAVIFLWYTDPQPERSHSSIQFYDATNLRNHMYQRSLESFHSDPLPSIKDFLHELDHSRHNESDNFINLSNNISLFIDHNKFSLLSTHLDVFPEPGDSARSHIKLDVQLRPSDSLPLTSSTSRFPFFSPLSHTVGILGFLPLSCFQQMIAMKLDVLEGFLDIDGELVDLAGSEAYVEKTWGRSFPEEYLWMHATRFSHVKSQTSSSSVDPSIDQSVSRISSLFFSVADVRILGSVSWPGFVSTLLYNGRYLHFASHLGSVINITHSDSNRVVIQLYDQSFEHELVIELDRADDVDQHSDAWLYAAKDGSMQKIIKQHIGRDQCTVTLNRLINNQSIDQLAPDEFTFHNYSRQLLTKGRTSATGLEVMIVPDGRLVKLIDEIYGSMRPWSNNWFHLNTRLISLSMSTSALFVALKLTLESISQMNTLRWLVASVIVAVSVLVLRRTRLNT